MSDIDQQITQIQKSTRTSFGVFVPLHERLRMRFRWYYNWHLKWGSKWVHLGVLALYILALGAFGFSSYKTTTPTPALATGDYVVSGLADMYEGANGDYTASGTYNGKTVYVHSGGSYAVGWSTMYPGTWTLDAWDGMGIMESGGCYGGGTDDPSTASGAWTAFWPFGTPVVESGGPPTYSISGTVTEGADGLGGVLLTASAGGYDDVTVTTAGPGDAAPHNMTSDTAPSPYVVSANNETTSAHLNFDGNGATDWLGTSPGWVSLDLGSGRTVTSYKIKMWVQTPPFTFNPNRAPQDWTYEGSNDGTNWDVLDTVVDQTSWTESEERTFTCDTSSSYRYYRINISANNGDSLISIGEMYMYADADGTYTLPGLADAVTWNVTPSKDTYSFTPADQDIAISGGSETGIDFSGSTGPTGVTISGTCKQYDEATNCADSETVKVAVNEVLQAQTGTTSGGTWSISGVTAPSSGDTITVFIDGVADGLEANAVTKYDGTGDITGINLFEKHLSLGSDDNQTLSNADISLYDSSVSSDEDIFFDVDASNNLLLPAAGTQTDTDQKLIVKASNTYQPASGGGVSSTVPILSIPASAVVTLDSNTLALSSTGTVLSITGTFNSDTSTVQYTGGTTATNVTAATYHNLYINRASTTFTAAGNITVNGVFTINAGTFNASDKIITLAGTTGTPFVINGTFTSSTSTVKFTGDWAGGDTTIVWSTYYNLYIDNASETYKLNGDTTVSSVLTVNAGTFAPGSRNIYLTGSGTPFVITGTFSSSQSHISYSGTSATNIAATTYYNLTFNRAGTTFTAAGDITVNYIMNIQAGTFNGSDKTITLTVAGGPLQISGTFAASTSTVKYTGGTSATTITAATYHNLYLDRASTTYSPSADLTVTGVLTINAGTLDASNKTITLSGSGTPFVKTGTFTASTSTIKYTGTSATNVAAATYNNLTLDYSGTTFTAAGAVTASGTLTTTADSIYNNNGQTLTAGTLSNLGKVQLQGGETVTITTKDTTHGTIEYTGTGDYTAGDLAYGASYYNLTFNGSGGQWTQSETASVGGDLRVSAGSITLGSNNRLLTVTGTTYIDGGTFTIPHLGNYYSKLTTGALTISTGTYVMGNFGTTTVTGAFTQSGGTFTNYGWTTVVVGGNCDMSAGTLTVPSTLTLNGNSATFTPNSATYGTVRAAKTAGQTLTFGGDFTASGFYVDSGSIDAGATRLTIVNNSTAGLATNGQSLYDLTLNGLAPAVTGNSAVSHNVTFSGNNTSITDGITLTVQNGATAVIDSGKAVIGAGTLVLVDGAGANLANSGTLSATARFQTSTSNVTVPAGSYGRIQAYNASASSYSVILGTAGSQTINIVGDVNNSLNGYLLITNEGAGNLLLDGTTYNPTVNISSRPLDTTDKGKIYFSGSGGGTKTLSAGSGTWSVKGDVNLTGGLLTAGNSTFNLNGTVGGQTVTSNSQSFKNLTIANTHADGVTFADAAATTGTFADTTGSTKITFNSDSTYHFNTINIAGAADHLITLAPSGATNWTLNPTTVTGVSYVTVSKSTNSGTEFCATYSTDGGDNINWNIGAAGSCQTVAPTDVAVSGIDSTYFDVTWTDASSDETGFKVFISTLANADCSLATYPESPDYTTAAGVETQHVTGKSINTQYCAKVLATGPNGDSAPAYAAAPKYTLANTPSAPTVEGDYSAGDGYYTLLHNNANNNPSGTLYWVQYSTNGVDYSDPAGMSWSDLIPYYKRGALANTQYWFKVKAKNGDGTETTYSTAGADVTPPTAPTDLITTNICSTTATTTWGATTAADRYTFSYGTDTAGTNLGTTANITDTVHNLADLTDGETYYWKVSATSDTNGTGAYSAIEDFTTGTCLAPIAPTDFSGSAASSTQIDWSWGNTTGETGWKVQATDHTTLVTLPADSLSWNETPLSVNTAYTRHVNVYNDFGSNDSNQDTVYTLANVPSAPTVSAVATGIKIVVNKNSNPEANTRYAIYNQTESMYVKHADGTLQADPDWQLYADWGGASGFTNTGLDPNVSYNYQVKAQNGDEILTAFSDGASIYTFANVPSAPTLSATSTTSLTAVVNENSNPAGTEYAVYESSTSKYVQADGTLGAGVVWQDYTTWGGAAGVEVTGLSVNVQYTFSVKARNTDNLETALSSSAAKYTLANVPLAPTVATVSANAINVKINQNSNPVSTRYAIYNQTEGEYINHADGSLQVGADWQTYATWGGVSGIDNVGLAAGTSYTYQVKAENGDDVATAFSDGASANTTYPTVGFAASTDSASISHASNTVAINLSSVSGTDASVDYAVTGGTAVSGVDYTFVDGTASIAHGQTGVNVGLTLINDHLVGSNKTIIFTLSNPVNTTLGAVDTLTFTIINDNPAPSGSFTINSGATKTNNRTVTLTLTYNLATQVKIATSPDFAGAAYEAIASSKSYTLPDADATYTVYIKLKDQYGNESESYSNSITLDRVAPTPPSNLAAIGGNTTISLSWTNPSEADFTFVRVYRGLAAGFSIAHADKTFDVYKPGATYVDSDVVNDKQYYYKVTSHDNIGNVSAVSAEVNAKADSDNPTTPGKPSISQPTNEFDGKVYTTEQSIDFNWTASTDDNSGLQGYYLTIATTSGGNDILNAQEIAADQTSYHHDFTSDGIYYVRVYAEDNKGNRSADSDEFIFYIDKSAPSDPSEVLMYDASDRSTETYAVALSWKSSTDDVSGLKGYVILRDGTAINTNADNLTQNIITDENSGFSFYLDILSADAKASYSIKAIDNASNETSAQDAHLAPTSLTSTTGQSVGSTQIELPTTVIGEGKLDISDVKVTPSEVVSDKTQAKVTWKTGVPATSQVLYGTSTSYDLKTELDTGLNSAHTVILSDLNPSATYHFKVVSKDKNGKELSSSDQTFSTGGMAKDKSILEIITGTLSDAFTRMWNSVSGFFTSGASAAENMGAINALSVVDISTDEQPGFAIFWPQNMGTVSVEREGSDGFTTVGTTDQNFYIDLTVKERGDYSYRVGGLTAAAADELSGKSTISAIKITAGAVDKKEASVIVSFKTDKLATGQVSYGEGSPSSQSQPEDGLNQSHVILIEKLKPSTTYTFTLKATDKSGAQIVTSSAQNYTTPASPRDTTVLEIIIKALQNAFSGFDQFMKNER